jgi:hypothetical protein
VRSFIFGILFTITETPADLRLHLVIDNYATHKHSKVKT